MEETELRERLGFIAARTSPPLQDPDDLTAAVVERHLARRKRGLAVGAAAAALAVIVVAVPVVVSRTGEDKGPAAPAPSSAVYTVPTRGNLADEAFFVDGVRQLSWTGGPAGVVAEPPLDSRHVVWAGLVGRERWALVAGADPGAPLPPDEDGDGRRDLDRLESVGIAWFRGTRVATADQMVVYGEPRIVDADEPAAVLSPTKPYGTIGVNKLVVVGAPDDRVEVAWFRQIAPDGEIFREFEPVRTVDGVAAIDAGQVDASIDRALRYRVVRGGTEFSGLPDTQPRPDFVPPEVDLARLRPPPPPAPGDAAVTPAIDTLISHLGVWAHILDLTVLWAGDLPAPDGSGARVTVLASQYEDWGVYLTGALGRDIGGQVATSSCGSEIRPSGTPLEDLVVVLRCGSDGGPEGALPDSLVVVAPAGATTAQALDDRGEPIASHALVDGVAVVPVPADLASVAVVGADGETIDERAPMGRVDWGD